MTKNEATVVMHRIVVRLQFQFGKLMCDAASGFAADIKLHPVVEDVIAQFRGDLGL
jgi:hypothetical protein